MFFEQITYGELAQISGMTAAISLCIGWFLGAIVLAKAIKTKQIIIFMFFLAILFTLSPWYPSGMGYMYWVFTHGEIFSYEFYILLGTVGIPIAIIAWLYVYMGTINPKKRKLVLLIFGMLSIIYEIYIFYNLFFAEGAPVMEALGTFEFYDNPTDIKYHSLVLIFLAGFICTAVITGIHFSLTSMKIKENKELQWKGRFLFIAFLMFGFAATFDAIIPMETFLLVVIRLILMATTVFFYLGFILPKWIKKILKIEEEDLPTTK